VQSEIVFNKGIRLFALDRSHTSCVHRTEFCRSNCYNRKLYRIYPNMHQKDIRNEQFWDALDGNMFRRIMGRKKLYTGRFRFCTRGEAFSNFHDVEKVKNILVENPEILFWIPTRAWRDKDLRVYLQTEIQPLRNNRMMASIDPTNTEDEIRELKEDKWSTLFFGDDEDTKGRVLCPKTWAKWDGYCQVCGGGCFSRRRVDVHLKKH